MGIYGAIFKKILGKDKDQTKKRKKTKTKKMGKTKLTAEQKQARRQKILGGLKKVGSQVMKYQGGKPTVKVTAKKSPPVKTETAPATNFWTDEIDMKFIKPTGKQLVIGGSAVLIGGALLYKAFK